MFSPKKTSNNHSFFSGRNTLVLVLLFAIFTSTCLLPISEAKAKPLPKVNIGGAKVINKIPGTLGGAGTKTAGKASTKASSKGMLSGFGSGFTTAITIGAIAGLIEILMAIARSFVNYMLSPDPALYDLNSVFVQKGWRMIRDICNLFFLLVLLFIAFCTILQVEKYNAKKNLLTLILMALLINFSKPIAIFIFDGSQLLMNWFLGSGTRENIVNSLGFFSQIGTAFSNMMAQQSVLDMIPAFLFTIIFGFVLDVVLFCLGLFLLIRIVAIWLIVIVSPVAFFAMILPDFRKLSSQWWDALFRYSYVGPAIAFFLWLGNDLNKTIGKGGLSTAGADSSTTAFLNMGVFIPYMITIVFLFAALMMANQFGIQFSQAITKSAEKFMGWAAINALKWGERAALMKTRKVKIGEKEFSFTLSPRAWIKGWQEHSAEIDRRALEQASAHPRDVLSSTFKRGERPKTYFRDLMFGKLQEEKKKELQMISVQSEYLLDQIERAKKKKTPEAQATAAAATELMFGENDQDDYSIDSKKMPLNPFKAKRHLLKDLTDTGMSEQQAMRHMNRLGYIALPKGNVGFWKMTRFNTAQQKWELTPDADQLLGINAKSRTVETQGYAKVAHRDSFMIEDAHPDRDIDPHAPVRVFVGVHAVGSDQAGILAENKAALTQFLARNKLDTLDAIAGHVGEGLFDSMRIWTDTAVEQAARLKGIGAKWEARAERDAKRGDSGESASARARAKEYSAMAEEALTHGPTAKQAAAMKVFFKEALSARDKKKEKGASAEKTGAESEKGGGTDIKELVAEIRNLAASIAGRPTPTVLVKESENAPVDEDTDDPDNVND